MIVECGYEHDQIECTTLDGYINQMDRIVNTNSYNIVYFQHGYMDSSLSWIIHGQEDSIAYAARDSGYDVFAGNLRGMYPRKCLKEVEDKYWDYCIDDYAIYDIPAFLEKIIEIKVQELRESHKIKNN